MPFVPQQAPANLDTDGLRKFTEDQYREIARAWAEVTDNAAALATKVAKAGDTMTGPLTLSGAPTVNLHAATKQYVDIRSAIKLVTFTFGLSGSGNQSITGIGFRPRYIQFQTGVAGGSVWASFGSSDVVTNGCVEILAGTGGQIYFQPGMAGIQRDGPASSYGLFTVASMDADGFTLTWTRVGTPTATCSVNATCFA